MAGDRTIELLDHAVAMRLFINPGVGVQHLVPRFRELCAKREAQLAAAAASLGARSDEGSQSLADLEVRSPQTIQPIVPQFGEWAWKHLFHSPACGGALARALQ